MSSLKVELAPLAEYSKYLSSMEAEIESSKDNLISTIESIKGSWKGTDADTFVANATAYLENLSVISGLLAQYGGIVGSKVKRYAQGIEQFYAILG